MKKENLNQLIQNTKIQFLLINDIKPYSNNPRKIKNVDKVAKSIAEFGFQQPIVVDKNNIIIVGHTRYQASKQLGLEKVPVLIADLTEQQAKAYRIVDNRLNEDNEWDKDLLNIEIDDLKDYNSELLNFGFDDKELDNILKTIVDEIKPLPNEAIFYVHFVLSLNDVTSIILPNLNKMLYRIKSNETKYEDNNSFTNVKKEIDKIIYPHTLNRISFDLNHSNTCKASEYRTFFYMFACLF